MNEFLFQIFQVKDREEEVLADCRLEVCGSNRFNLNCC